MIRVEGVDLREGAYRIALTGEGPTIRALVPEHLLGGSNGERPSHQTAHERLAAQSRPLTTALRTLAAGRTPRPPYDTLTLTGT